MKPFNTNSVTLLLQIGPQKVKALVEWLDKSRNNNEFVEAVEWHEDRWHIWLRDKTVSAGPADAMIGFSVNVVKDEILWNNPSTGRPMTFLRSHRWFRLLKKEFPEIVTNNQFEDYRKTSGPHLKVKVAHG